MQISSRSTCSLLTPITMSRKNSNAQSSRSQASLSPSPSTSPTSQALTTTTGSILLLVFIHGFKGTDTTFEEFPQRLQHLLTQTVPNLNVESLVFPAYEVRRDSAWQPMHKHLLIACSFMIDKGGIGGSMSLSQ